MSEVTSIEEFAEEVRAWCLRHVGRELPVTCCKDMAMVALYDDRAVQVVRNEGALVMAPGSAKGRT